MVKVALCRFQQSLGTFAMFVVENTPKTRFYRHLYNHLFRGRRFGNYIGYEGQLFFENVQNLMLVSKFQRKVFKEIFGF